MAGERGAGRVPVAGSQTRTVCVGAGGDEHGAAVEPVPNATASTPSVWPVSGAPTGVPVAGSQTRTVWSALPEMISSAAVDLSERHRGHRVGVAGERVADRGAGGGVPDPHRVVGAAGDDHGAAVDLSRGPPRSPGWCGR